MEDRFLWLGLFILIVVAIVAVILWAGGERPSWADWQDEHHDSGRRGKDDGADD